jgi:glutathione S-transferase
MTLSLVIGNKNYSSWSMRPWLFLRHAGIEFEEIVVTLYQADFAERIRKYSRALRVPVLVEDGTSIWDSLAICEYVAEKAGFGWPRDPVARAIARSVSAEMHSGFQAMRSQYPFNARGRDRQVPPTPELVKDIRRIDEIWQECRSRFGEPGSWLFGAFSIADAMFAPVALRFQTYRAPGLSEVSQAYLQTVLADPHVIDWLRASEAETYAESDIDSLGR